jgi:hypothetical protein
MQCGVNVCFCVTLGCKYVPASLSLAVCVQALDHTVEEASSLVWRELKHLLGQDLDRHWHEGFSGPDPVACHSRLTAERDGWGCDA